MPPAPTLTHDPLLETQVFWDRNKIPILVGLLIALCALAAYGGYRLYSARQDASADAVLATAKDAADFKKVVDQYPGSPAASSAMLLLAEAQRKEKKFAEANTTLEEFLKRNPKHELVTTARMALAANFESLGKTDDALGTYRRIAAEHPRDFNAPIALLSEVHLLREKGQIEDARRVCETVLTQYRESYASQEAANYLKLLKPPTAAAPAATTTTSPAPAQSVPASAASSAASVPANAVSPAASIAPKP